MAENPSAAMSRAQANALAAVRTGGEPGRGGLSRVFSCWIRRTFASQHLGAKKRIFADISPVQANEIISKAGQGRP